MEVVADMTEGAKTAKALLPCPFCGDGGVIVKTRKGGRFVECWDCGIKTPEFETDYFGWAYNKAVAAWNRREPEDTP